MSYLSPPTLTWDEQKLILRVAAKHPRDGIIFAMALGTGLRLSELLGLNVGDVFVPDKLVPKLKLFWRFKKQRNEGLDTTDALFCAQSRRRLSPRRVQFAWRQWQRRAGFDRLYPFHALRHSAVTNVYRATRDLFLAQRFARHASPLTTTVYTHPGDEDMSRRARNLAC